VGADLDPVHNWPVPSSGEPLAERVLPRKALGFVGASFADEWLLDGTTLGSGVKWAVIWTSELGLAGLAPSPDGGWPGQL
jgi:hypothetical protein